MRTWKRKLIHSLGGYADLADALEDVKKKQAPERYEVLSQSVRRLFNTVGAEDILRIVDGGAWSFQGKVLTEGDRQLLQAEAARFLNTKLWRVLQADIKYQANKRMFLMSEDVMQLTANKFWLYVLDAFKTRLESMSAGSGVFNKQ